MRRQVQFFILSRRIHLSAVRADLNTVVHPLMLCVTTLTNDLVTDS